MFYRSTHIRKTIVLNDTF